MQKAATSKIVCYLALALVTILCTGCIVPSQQALRTGDAPQENRTTAAPAPSAQPQGLIKPTIPEDRRHQEQPDSDAPLPTAEPESGTQPNATEQPKPEIPPPPSQRIQQQPESIPPGPPPEAQPTKPEEPIKLQPPPPKAPRVVPETASGQPPEKKEWEEDRKIKEAAMELAKNFPQVTKIKVCYAVKDDEWWVTLYDKAGAFTELKQYTWNRDLEKLEVFLVVKRIPSTRVPQQLNEEEPGKACEVLDAPNQHGKQ